MTLSPTWEWLLESAAGVCELAGHWFMQSTLLIAAGLLAGRFFYRRGPAFASAIYRTTFVAAIVCPLVTWALSVAGMTLGIATLPELRLTTIEMVAIYRAAEPAVPAAPAVSRLPDVTAAAAPRPETAEAFGAPTRPFEMSVPTRDARATLEAPPMENSRFAEGDRVTASTFGAAPPPSAPASPDPPATLVEMVPTLVFNPWISALVGAIACVWILGTSLLLVAWPWRISA